MFPAMHRESMIIRREMRVFSKSFADVLHDLGTTHPSVAFRDFVLRGYAVSQTTGGSRHLGIPAREAPGVPHGRQAADGRVRVDGRDARHGRVVRAGDVSDIRRWSVG